MNLTNFSLIYPNETTLSAHYSGKDKADISMFELEELGLTDILDLQNSDISEFFTTDPDVIKYRMDVFDDIGIP